MSKRGSSYLSSKLETRPVPSKGGFGTFVKIPVKQGEILAAFGGRVVSGSELPPPTAPERTTCVQVEDDLYLVPEHVGDGDYINHSCSPNAGFRGQMVLVAMRDISAQEEICYDYAMTDSSNYDEFKCGCGEPPCRGYITGNDWKRTDLQERYQGFFSAYLEHKISKITNF